MSRVNEIKKQIKKLYAELNQIQSECSHPKSYLIKEAKSSTGNYDPNDNQYWYDLHCNLCDKQWSEDQSSYNAKKLRLQK